MENQPNIYMLLGELNAKMDLSLSRQSEDRTAHSALAIRVTALERWKWHLMGGAVAASAIVSFALRYFLSG